MAETAHKTEDEKKEFFDSPEELDAKVTRLAELVRNSKHFIAFTGAGISTSAGVPDYRSGMNTVLPTGPGCWEKKAQGAKDTKKTVLRTSMLQAVPTKTHMALVELEQRGFLKFLISQNVDGLHRRSGFPPGKLAEVHGNTNLEYCKKKGCGKQYMRDFRCRTAQKVHDHATGRKCVCGGELYDSIINFGENLPDRELNEGFENSYKADLCLAMGSSLRVTPAANMPQEVGIRKRDLVIVNLQKTPLDKYCSLRIYALCDQVMELLAQKLQMPIPPFELQRRVTVEKGKSSVQIAGVDSDGVYYSLFKQVRVQIGEQNPVSQTITKEPFKYVNPKCDFEKGAFQLELQFHGHYAEPNLTLKLKMQELLEGQNLFELVYDPIKRVWKVRKIEQ